MRMRGITTPESQLALSLSFALTSLHTLRALLFRVAKVMDQMVLASYTITI